MIRLSHYAGLIILLAIALQCTSAPAQLYGDYSDNDKVDAADYVVFRQNLDTTNYIPNDITPYWVMQDDWDIWKINFGKSAPGGGGSGSVTPEPTSFCLSIFSSFLLYACGRRYVRQRGGR